MFNRLKSFFKTRKEKELEDLLFKTKENLEAMNKELVEQAFEYTKEIAALNIQNRKLKIQVKDLKATQKEKVAEPKKRGRKKNVQVECK